MPKTKKLRVFYSWQSDSPKESNLNAIRKALALAAKKIGATRTDLKVVPDEATRDTAGSPNIVLKLLEKIELADIFIADVTTITPLGASRPCPNPNVSYELGYAVGQLGWDRVILLFNEEIGTFPGDLPFDFAQHRANPYRLAPSDAKRGTENLAAFLEVAITAVIEKNPKRPAELRGLSREKLEHEHDVENMVWMMSSLHLPTMDQHILELPHRISDRALWFWENFKGVVVNSLFSLYDPILKNAVDQMFLAWQTALSHDSQYHETLGGHHHVFTNPGDMPLPPSRELIWEKIDASRLKMQQALDQILERLRESYIEVNLHKTNAKAWKDYVDFQKQFDPKPSKKSRKLKKPHKKRR